MIVRGCLMLAVQANGRRVDTIEGMSDPVKLPTCRGRSTGHNALQCGFCTPGVLMSAQELLSSRPATRDETACNLAGNYCRCTGYHAIVDAVEEVLASRREGRK